MNALPLIEGKGRFRKSPCGTLSALRALLERRPLRATKKHERRKYIPLTLVPLRVPALPRLSGPSPALGHDRPRAWPGWNNLLKRASQRSFSASVPHPPQLPTKRELLDFPHHPPIRDPAKFQVSKRRVSPMIPLQEVSNSSKIGRSAQKGKGWGRVGGRWGDVGESSEKWNYGIME